MKITKNLLSVLLTLITCVTMIPMTFVSGLTVLTESKIGEEDGYSYELWKDYGNTTMTLTGNGAFTCSWDNIGNALFRTGRKYGCTSTYKEMDPIYIEYEADYQPNGNSYLCVYGWTRDPLIEYYIVESWGSWRPPGGSPLGQIEVDGGTYDVYRTERVNKPSIDGDTTFYQYWSVRTTKREKGTISVSKHFEEWEKMGLPAGKLYEAALNVEGYQSSGKATILKNNFVNSPGIIEPTTKPEPATTNPDGYYFHSTFEDGTDRWTARGEDKIASTSDAAFNGSKSLSVTGRTDSWNGAAKELDTNTFKPGLSYSFSAMAKPMNGSEKFRLTLQYTLNGEDNYDGIAEASSDGEWVQLSNTSFTIPTGATNLLLYMETADGTNSFYLDEVIAAPQGTKITPQGNGTDVPDSKKGDVNGDGSVNVADLASLQGYILEKVNDAKTPDINEDGAVDAFDLVMLRQILLKNQG